MQKARRRVAGRLALMAPGKAAVVGGGTCSLLNVEAGVWHAVTSLLEYRRRLVPRGMMTTCLACRGLRIPMGQLPLLARLPLGRVMGEERLVALVWLLPGLHAQRLMSQRSAAVPMGILPP